jgi:hypothetical protein
MVGNDESRAREKKRKIKEEYKKIEKKRVKITKPHSSKLSKAGNRRDWGNGICLRLYFRMFPVRMSESPNVRKSEFYKIVVLIVFALYSLCVVRPLWFV